MDVIAILGKILEWVGFAANFDYSGVIFWLKMLAVFFSTLFIYGIIYSIYQENQVYKTVRAFLKPAHVPVDRKKNVEEWQKILQKGASENESERKFAIIAADTLIERILELAGYKGENLGERLKKVEKGDLDSLDALWEAHKIRNRIAHEADHKLSSEEASRALARFEEALKELEYI